MISINQKPEVRRQRPEDRNQKREGRLFSVLSHFFSVFCLLSFILSFLFTACYAADIKSSFYQASLYYEQGNFEEAIKQYNSILESGLESGNLYYNLGNCYFKKGELCKAILNYEKARRLIPLDKDLESNYGYARSLIKGGEIISQKSLLPIIFGSLFDKFTINSLTLLLSISYILILIGVLTGFLFRSFKKHALIFTIFLGSFFLIVFAGLKGEVAFLNRRAIVAVEQTDAKFEPMDKATAYFTLYEGMKVEVISSKANWYKVRRQDNKSGWVEKGALAIF